MASNHDSQSGACATPRLLPGLCTIIEHELASGAVSSRALVAAGVIRRRQGFRERLAKAQLATVEIEALIEHLDIDLVRAILAIAVFADPAAYGATLGRNLADICRALKDAVKRESGALEYAFEPMRPALCAAVADRICQALALHHARIEQARSAML